MRIPAGVRAGWAGICVLAACSVSDPTNPNLELPDNAGTLIPGTADIPSTAPLFFSPDGSEVYYEATDGSVRAASITQGALRTVDPPRTRGELSAARAGKAVYFIAERSSERASAFRAAAGGITALTDHAPGTTVLGQADGLLVLGGPGDAGAAYIVAPDSLHLYDVASGARRFLVAGCLRVVAFAPDGTRVLCRTAGPRDAGYAVASTAGGLTPLDLLDGEGIIRVVRWDADAVRVLFTQNNRFRIHNVESDATVILWAPGFAGGPRVYDFLHYTWSADGSRFAYWVHECLRLDRVGECSFGQSVLYVIDLSSNTGRSTVVVKGERGADQVALAPDGHGLVYAFGGRLYYKPIP
jgi:hypothetical protein